MNNFVYEVHSSMSLRDKIDNDYKNALKSKDKNKISTYRLILSGLKDLDIQNRSGPNHNPKRCWLGPIIHEQQAMSRISRDTSQLAGRPVRGIGKRI